MAERCCLLLGIILCLALVSDSRVIVPRALPEDKSSGNGELPISINPLEKDKKLDLETAIWGSSTRDDDFNAFEGDKRVYHPRGPVLDYDFVGLDRRVDDIPEIISERFPSREDPNELPETKPEENDDTATDDNFKKTFDEEHPYRPDNNDKDLESSHDENKPIHKDGEEPEIAEEFEGNNDDKDFKSKDKERPDEENDIFEDDQAKPDEENDKPEDDEKKSDEEEEKEMHKPKDDDDEEEMHKPKNDDEKHDEEDEEMHKPEDDDEKPDEEDEETHKPKDDDERPDEEEEMHKPKDDDERPDEEEMHKAKDDDEKNDIPDEEPTNNGNKDEGMPEEVDEETVDHEDEESVNEAEEAEISSDGSIFDNPFFNLEQVKKYFSTLERALGHVFRQSVDEAILLNGTYANTTEEEVEIDGKKYIIMKSVIKGGDNHSSLYVESLSSKPKMNESETVEDIKITNVTRR